MPTCPLCLHENSDEASACEHCGRFRFRTADETDVAEEASLDAEAARIAAAEAAPRFGDPNAPTTVATLTERPPLPVPPKRARLVVIRGLKVNEEFPLYDGPNYLGRTAERPADIDLSGLEPPEQVWSSRQHAIIYSDTAGLCVEDLNSLNGTFVNRARLRGGKRYPLKPNDIIQIGTVQLKLVLD